VDGLVGTGNTSHTYNPVLAVLVATAAAHIRSLFVAQTQKCRKGLLEDGLG
jgi:hypothetical protein